MTGGDNRQPEEWFLYQDPELLSVRVGKTWEKYVQIVLGRSDDTGIEIGACLVGDCRFRGDAQVCDSEQAPRRIWQVALELDIEQIPRLIVILNEIYRLHYEEAAPYLRLDDEELYGELDERLAKLLAYKVVADQLSDHANKLGLFSPME